MKYHYLYQTKDNENREGWIKARNRDNAYALLRKQGIRPYRLIGDDPVNWKPWAAGGAIAALSAALAISLVFKGGDNAPLARSQIEGDASLIAAGVYCGWTNVLGSALDRHLAAYAQPGHPVPRPEVSDTDAEKMVAEIEAPVEIIGEERPEYARLSRIVEFMKDDLRSWISKGGDLKGYFDYLDERQADECAFREKAVDAVYRAPESMRYRAWLGVNARLRDMGIAPLDRPAEAEEDGNIYEKR